MRGDVECKLATIDTRQPSGDHVIEQDRG